MCATICRWDFKGFDVVALNVTKLRSDNFDPRNIWRGSIHGAPGWSRAGDTGE